VVCSLRPEKGLPTLLHAFTLLQPQYPGARLLLVGSGPLEAELQQLANDLGIAHNTRFVPTQSNVADWLRQIDIFVLPSLSEALSNALMEAMACGCACVASNVGGNPELLGEDRGLLFESGDVHQLFEHLQTLAGDAELRQQLRESSLQFVRANFTREASVARMSAIYRSFLP
jgi:glycosyltransferase involved in cell wall biosynthesis